MTTQRTIAHRASMPRYSVTPDRLFDRPWRSGHPFRPRCGRLRKWCMVVVLLLLSLVIFGYVWVTDANRVKTMAEIYLSRLIGARVTVDKATLSIFQGLRLGKVKVHVDDNPDLPGSLIFEADSFVVNYDPRKMLAGQLEASEIVAQKPHVVLALSTGPNGEQWNYQRLGRKRPVRPPPSADRTPHRLPLPQVLLRNAEIELTEWRGSRLVSSGKMAIDGQLTPLADGRLYGFELQSRGALRDGQLGPYIHGAVAVNDGALTAQLRDFEFSKDILRMLPHDVRDWWERHELAGGIKTTVAYTPPHGTDPGGFRIQTDVSKVELAVHAEEWSGRDEVRHYQNVQEAVRLMRQAYRVAGFPVQVTPPPQHAATQPAIATLPRVEAFARLTEMLPLRLRDVDGSFIFTEQGVEVDHLTGRVVTAAKINNAFTIKGKIEGYSPDAAAHITVTSAEGEPLIIPAAPKYFDAMPAEVREFYQSLKPQGQCRITFELNRPTPGSAPKFSGFVDIIDGQFLFNQFPYPLQHTTGRVAFERDPMDGRNYVRVIGIRAHGTETSANRDATITVNGRIGPLGPETPEPGFKLKVVGTNVTAERALLDAMPGDVRNSLKIFDAPGKGQFPQFNGNFVTQILRAPGPHKKLTFDTDVTLLDAAGELVDFRYPLRHVHGLLKIRDGFVDIIDVRMTRGDASLRVDGRVKWKERPTKPPIVTTNINVAVANLPVDSDLRGAIPPEQRDWIKRLGLCGTLDVNGRVFSKPRDPNDDSDKSDDVDYSLAVDMRKGTLWPAEGMFSLSDLAGKLHLTRERLDILNLHAKRDKADVTATGEIAWGDGNPRIRIDADATDLAMDMPLYNLLPADARRSWDQVRPEGGVDAAIHWTGSLGKPNAKGSQDGFRAVLKPRALAVNLRTLPYRLDLKSGSIRIDPEQVRIDNVEARHGEAKVLISGAGTNGPTSSWKLHLVGESLPADDELRKAMPPSLLTVFDALQLKGTLGFDFPRLSYRSRASSADPDIDIGGEVTIRRGTMDAGVPLTDVRGGMTFDAVARDGRLASLRGAVRLDSLSARGRPIDDLRIDLLKPADKSELRLDNLRAKVAGGELGGAIAIFYPDDASSRYTMSLVLRNADVKDLVQDKSQDIKGDLTASLSLEGSWGDAGARRGRGDVVVAGKQMYQIPLMLGLLQVTNLSLPIGGPFTKGTARYNVEGQKVNFEQIELRADQMMMTGGGSLDFGTKQVRMTFSTDNPAAFKIPFFHDLWQGARQELLKINIRGTVQAPKVEPTSMGIFTTTVDEVFRGEGKR